MTASQSTNLAAGTWLVTGGCGFIGSEFIRQAIGKHPGLAHREY